MSRTCSGMRVSTKALPGRAQLAEPCDPILHLLHGDLNVSHGILPVVRSPFGPDSTPPLPPPSRPATSAREIPADPPFAAASVSGLGSGREAAFAKRDTQDERGIPGTRSGMLYISCDMIQRSSFAAWFRFQSARWFDSSIRGLRAPARTIAPDTPIPRLEGADAIRHRVGTSNPLRMRTARNAVAAVHRRRQAADTVLPPSGGRGGA